MHDVRKLGLQVFAAPNNMTGQAQIQVKAREIDFVTSFGKSMQALLDFMGMQTIFLHIFQSDSQQAYPT